MGASKKGNDPMGAVADKEPSMAVISQYIKDFSFENPNPLDLLNQPASQPAINIDFKVDVKSTSKDIYEIVLSATIDASQESKKMFLLEIAYAGLFNLVNMNQDMLDMVTHVECPRMLFPFLRSIVANATADGGFAPLYLSPVNFAEFYNQRREEQKNKK